MTLLSSREPFERIVASFRGMADSKDMLGSFNRAGGWAYHRRAALAGARWEPFRREIKVNLFNWVSDPHGKTLVIVGPSGGYTLAWDWIVQFQKIIALEPDPIARWVFQTKLGLTAHRLKAPCPALSFIVKDLIISPALKGTESFSHLELNRQSSCFLFANVWGQIGALTDSAETVLEYWSQNLLWQECIWFSYHDRLSFASRDQEIPQFGMVPYKTQRELVEASLASAQESGQGSIAEKTASFTDHLTAQLMPIDAVKGYYCWPLRRNYWHWIEVAFVSPPR